MIPPPGPHGGDAPAIAAALGLDPARVVDLSQTLNPCAPDVAAVVARHLDRLRCYPQVTEATAALAATLGVDAGRVLLTHGGAEAIALVASVVGGRVRSEPEFSLHPRGVAGPVWRSDPHSPSGRLAGHRDRADVWDEAFYPLATGRWSAHRPGVVVGSLTKVFACPGLRLGYVIADDLDRFARRQLPWSVSSLAAASLVDLLAVADLARWAATIAARRDELVSLLATHGLVARAADAPWVLVRAPGLRERLAPHGVIVRDTASFGLPGHVRIAVPDDRGMALLAQALEQAARTKELR